MTCKVCLKSNETGAIKFFINIWTTDQHYPLQSSSRGKPHTAAVVAPTPGINAGSLNVEVPSAGLSRRFGCFPQFQNDDLWGGIWVSGKGMSHGLRSGEYGDCRTTGMPFLVKKNSFTEVAVWQGALSWCTIQVSAISGRTRWTLFFWFVQGPHDGTDHSDCQTSIRSHESPHFGHIFFRFWSASSSRTRFVFHTLTAIQKCFMPPKNLCPW